MYIAKETKWHLSCRCHDNSYAADPALIKTKLPRFHLTQGSSTPNNLMGRVETMWEPCLFPGTPCSTQKGCKWGSFISHRKRLEPRVLPWQQYSRCPFVSFVMYRSGAKFEDHCSNISGDILNSVFYRFSGTIYDVITFLICIIQKCNHLKNEKWYSKKENATLLYFKKPFK